MQHNSGGTVHWQRTQFQIYTGKFAKIVHPDFFGEDGGRSSHHSDLENQWLQVVDYDEDTGDQNGKPSTLPYPFPYTQHIIITSIAFCQSLSMHRLQSTSTKVKKENPQLGSNPDHSSTFLHQSTYWLAAETIDVYESPIDNIFEPSSPNF